MSTHFDTLSAQLTETDKTELERNSPANCASTRCLRIEATGHTDNVPISERSRTQFADNLVLSEARARTVGEYLAGLLNLADAALVIHGLGSTRPVALNHTDQGRARNRRVELHIVTETMLG